MDRQTDGIAIAYTRYSYAVARKKEKETSVVKQNTSCHYSGRKYKNVKKITFKM